MTIRFNGLQLTKIVPVTLIIFNYEVTENHSFYWGIIGNQNALDEIKYTETSVEEILKTFKRYLDSNNILLTEKLPYKVKSDEVEIEKEYLVNEFMLFNR